MSLKGKSYGENDPWRETVYTCALDALTKPPSDLYVGFLCAHGQGIPMLLHLGFRKYRLVPIEWNKAMLARALTRYDMCGQGYGMDVVKALAKRADLGLPRLDILNLDFCASVSRATVRTIGESAASEAVADHAVFIIKVAKGRNELVHRDDERIKLIRETLVGGGRSVALLQSSSYKYQRDTAPMLWVVFSTRRVL